MAFVLQESGQCEPLALWFGVLESMSVSLPQFDHWRIAGAIVLVLLGHALLMAADAHGQVQYEPGVVAPSAAALDAPQQQVAVNGRRMPKHRTACGAVQLAAQPPNGSDRHSTATEAGSSTSMPVPADDESSPNPADGWQALRFDPLTDCRAILQVYLN